MKNRNIILFVAALALLVVAVLSLSDDLMSPYVSFDYARNNADSYVQIIGALDKGAPVQHHQGAFSFTLTGENGETMKARHQGQMPLNFDHADRIVLLGKYDSAATLFEADKVLVKCPSKYSKEQ
jgi:cytochrome c-type biogenesis protein CcmE